MKEVGLSRKTQKDPSSTKSSKGAFEKLKEISKEKSQGVKKVAFLIRQDLRTNFRPVRNSNRQLSAWKVHILVTGSSRGQAA